MRTPESHQTSADTRDRIKLLEDLTTDLWWFIENVNEDTPDRTERFFALRERYCKVVQS